MKRDGWPADSDRELVQQLKDALVIDHPLVNQLPAACLRIFAVILPSVNWKRMSWWDGTKNIHILSRLAQAPNASERLLPWPWVPVYRFGRKILYDLQEVELIREGRVEVHNGGGRA